MMTKFYDPRSLDQLPEGSVIRMTGRYDDDGNIVPREPPGPPLTKRKGKFLREGHEPGEPTLLGWAEWTLQE